MAPTSTPPATSTAQAVGAFVAEVAVSSRDVGIGTLLGGGDTEYIESASVQQPSPAAGASLFLDGAATAMGAETPGAAGFFSGPGSAK